MYLLSRARAQHQASSIKHYCLDSLSLSLSFSLSLSLSRFLSLSLSLSLTHSLSRTPFIKHTHQAWSMTVLRITREISERDRETEKETEVEERDRGKDRDRESERVREDIGRQAITLQQRHDFFFAFFFKYTADGVWNCADRGADGAHALRRQVLYLLELIVQKYIIGT